MITEASNKLGFRIYDRNLCARITLSVEDVTKSNPHALRDWCNEEIRLFSEQVKQSARESHCYFLARAIELMAEDQIQ